MEQKTEQELINQSIETFRDEGSDAHQMLGPTRAEESRDFFNNIIKTTFSLIDNLPIPEQTITLLGEPVPTNLSPTHRVAAIVNGITGYLFFTPAAPGEITNIFWTDSETWNDNELWIES